MGAFRLPLTPMRVALIALGLVITLGLFMRRHLVAFLVVTLVIAVIVLGVVLWLMMRELRAAQAGKGIQSDIDRQVEREIEKSTFGQDVVVRNLKAEWDAAMAEFRRSPVGRRLGDRALAQLPMYFVIGSEGAGKSAFIGESGLTSVLRDAEDRPRAVRGVGGGRQFNWWFTEQAFLLDLTGKMLKRSQFEDDEDWVAFLHSLGKQRPERPINGVVVAVSVQDVAGAGKDKIEALAQAIRERLRDMGHHLGMEFPVYVVFTQCDRIAGFAETFAGFSAEQSAQPWGATLSFAKSKESAAESLFDAEYSALIASLADLRTSRVHRLTDDGQRMRALAFPAQLDRMRADLAALVKSLFQRGKGEAEGGFFRGFYFTCTRVGAETVDHVAGEAAAGAGLTPRLEAPIPQVARRVWFSHNLWRKIILRDANLASASAYALKAARQRQWLLLGGCGAAYLLLTLMFVIVAFNASAPVRRVQASARALSDVGDEVVPRQALRLLDPARTGLEDLERIAKRKTFGQKLGAYAGDRVIPAAREFYVRKAEQLLLQPITKDVRDTLELQLTNEHSPFANLFYQYQAYRLLSDPHSAVESADSVVFGKVLVHMLRPELERVSDDSLRFYAALARAQARCLADHGEPRRRFGDFDEGLAARALDALRRRWSEWPSLYDDMIADANEAIPSLTVARILSEAKRKQELFTGNAAAPGAYTRAGWEGFVRPRLSVMKHMVRREKDPELQAQLGGAVSGLTSQLAKRYADDYVAQWIGFLNALQGRPQGPNGRVSLQREALAWDSEIDAVVRRTREETQLEGEPREISAVRTRFAPFELWLSRPKRTGFMDRVKSKLPFLRSDLDRTPMESFRASLTMALKDKQKQGINSSAYRIAENLAFEFCDPSTSPLRTIDPAVGRAMIRLLTVMRPVLAPATGGAGGGGFAGGGGGALPPGDPVAFANDWQSLVSQPFAAIQDQYPFGGGADVKIDDFASFFRPGGGLDQVYEKHFKGRVSRDGKAIGPPLAGMSPGLIAWLKRALAIQDAFFPSGSADPKLLFDVKTRATDCKPNGPLRSVTWVVGEQSFFYEMGDEPPVTLTWSAESAGRGSSVSADLNGKPIDGPKFEGEWGLFHVLDRASLAPAAGDHVKATWRFQGVIMTVEIIPRKTTHPFVSGFLRLGAPPAAGGN